VPTTQLYNETWQLFTVQHGTTQTLNTGNYEDFIQIKMQSRGRLKFNDSI